MRKKGKKQKPLTIPLFGTRVFRTTKFSRKAKKSRKKLVKAFKRKGTLSGK